MQSPERRNRWVEECLGASIVQEVSSLLLELETNTNWKAVTTDEWQQNCEKWVPQIHKFKD
ncbi:MULTISPECIES: hypothetical protein [unclassified Microcoleus]|uniref:hypothetical protein n=1 Tax=unclassified Microcoleus TaxID=2642155 RepID=UPI002FD1044A